MTTRVLLVVFGLCFLSSCATTCGVHYPVQLRGHSHATSYDVAALVPLPRLLEQNSTWHATKEDTCKCSMNTYAEIGRALYQRASADIQTSSHEVRQKLETSLKATIDTVIEWERFLRGCLWGFILGVAGLVIDLTMHVIAWSLLLTASVAYHHMTKLLLIASVLAFANFLVKKALAIFGSWPVTLLTFLLAPLKTFFRVLKSKPIYELATPGFKSITIPQDPPRNAVVLMQHEDGSPAGYASCVRLWNGENALLTASHVANQPKLFVASSRFATRIPLEKFNKLFSVKEGDLVMYQGPPMWESTIGCKGANLTCANTLAKCDASIYYRTDRWYSTNASLVGVEGPHVQVLSNTIAGFSGSPYFNGKTILGVHVGGNSAKTNNLMAVIPSIPGLTSPKYVFESPFLKGKMFTQEEIERFEVEMDEVVERIYDVPIRYKPLHGGKAWADEVDEEKPPVPLSALPKIQGNEEGGPVRQNKTAAPEQNNTSSAPTPSPLCGGIQGEDILKKVVEVLISKIDTSAIERAAIQKISESAMKKPHSRTRQRRRSSSKSSLPPSTTGSYVAPPLRSQVSSPVAASPGTTIRNKNKNQNGGGYLQRETQRWVKKSAASGGPSLAPKQS